MSTDELFNRAYAEICEAIEDGYYSSCDDLTYINYDEIYEWCDWCGWSDKPWPTGGYDPIRDAAIRLAAKVAAFTYFGMYD